MPFIDKSETNQSRMLLYLLKIQRTNGVSASGGNLLRSTLLWVADCVIRFYKISRAQRVGDDIPQIRAYPWEVIYLLRSDNLALKHLFFMFFCHFCRFICVCAFFFVPLSPKCDYGQISTKRQ